MNANLLLAHSIVNFDFLGGRCIDINLLTVLEFFHADLRSAVICVQLALICGHRKRHHRNVVPRLQRTISLFIACKSSTSGGLSSSLCIFLIWFSRSLIFFARSFSARFNPSSVPVMSSASFSCKKLFVYRSEGGGGETNKLIAIMPPCLHLLELCLGCILLLLPSFLEFLVLGN